MNEADSSVDAVLLLGPLYHLVDRDDRLAALSEARRVLRPGGVLAAAAISRYLAALEVGSNRLLDPEMIRLAGEVIETGTYQPFLGFTTAHCHRAAELRGEIHAAGFSDIQVLGIEGPSWATLDAIGLESFDDHAASAVAIAELLEDDPEAVSMSAHFLAIAGA